MDDSDIESQQNYGVNGGAKVSSVVEWDVVYIYI